MQALRLYKNKSLVSRYFYHEGATCISTKPRRKWFDWRVAFLATLAITLLLTWYKKRRQPRCLTFYSIEQFQAYRLNTFPYERAWLGNKAPYFAAFLYNYYYDQHFLIELSGTEKPTSSSSSSPETTRGRSIKKRRIWKIVSKLSAEEEKRMNQNRKCRIADTLKEPQYNDIDRLACEAWCHELYRHSRDYHTRKSMKAFTDTLNQPPSVDCAYMLLNVSDYGLLKQHLGGQIRRRCDLEKGVEIHLHYRPGLVSLFKYD